MGWEHRGHKVWETESSRVRKPALSGGQHELGGLRPELAGMAFDSARGDIHKERGARSFLSCP